MKQLFIALILMGIISTYLLFCIGPSLTIWTNYGQNNTRNFVIIIVLIIIVKPLAWIICSITKLVAPEKENYKNRNIFLDTRICSLIIWPRMAVPATETVSHKDQRLWAPTPALSVFTNRAKSGIKHTPFCAPDGSGFWKRQKDQYQPVRPHITPNGRNLAPALKARGYAVRGKRVAKIPEKIFPKKKKMPVGL